MKPLLSCAELGELVAAELSTAIIVLGAPIGRVEIEKRAWPVPASDDFLPRQAIDPDAGETLVNRLEHRDQARCRSARDHLS